MQKKTSGPKRQSIDWNVELLDDPTTKLQSPDTLKACFNSHGLYNNIQFVLRLSPKVHNKIAAMPEEIISYNFDAESLQAHSTYVHDTIHWWQHCGSTIGLMLSLSYVHAPNCAAFPAKIPLIAPREP